MADELDGKVTQEFVGLWDNNNEDKKAKRTKGCVIKRKLKFEDYKSCLKAAQIKNKINHLEKNKID